MITNEKMKTDAISCEYYGKQNWDTKSDEKFEQCR